MRQSYRWNAALTRWEVRDAAGEWSKSYALASRKTEREGLAVLRADEARFGNSLQSAIYRAEG